MAAVGQHPGVAGRAGPWLRRVRQLRQHRTEASKKQLFAEAGRRPRPRRGLCKPFLRVVKEHDPLWVARVAGGTAGRGLEVRGWAPQLAVLSHRAVACRWLHHPLGHCPLRLELVGALRPGPRRRKAPARLCYCAASSSVTNMVAPFFIYTIQHLYNRSYPYMSIPIRCK